MVNRVGKLSVQACLRFKRGFSPSLSRLLVEDVDGHDAERVVVLDGAGGAVRVERALGHLREDHVERVGAALLHRGQDVLKMPWVVPSIPALVLTFDFKYSLSYFIGHMCLLLLRGYKLRKAAEQCVPTSYVRNMRGL